MTGFAQPWLLAIAGVGALGITLLHLWSWQRPTPRSLPTARFLPATSPRTRWRTLRFTDLLAWALRVGALGALGVAAAGPLTPWGRRGQARVVVVDASRAVARPEEVRDTLARLLAPGRHTVVVQFDSTARVVPVDSAARRHAVVGHLAAGLLRGVREATALAARAAQVDLVVVTPLAGEAWSPALAPIAASWPGALTLVRVGAARPVAGDTLPAILPGADDPVGAALRLGGVTRGVVVRRDVPGPGDSLRARGGGVLVTWPPLPADSTVRGLVVAGRTIVGALARREVADGTVLWRWDDGTPAATERPLGAGCTRDVGVGFPVAGDLPIRAETVALAATLLAPCGQVVRSFTPDTTWVHAATGAPLAPATPNAWLQRGLLVGAVLLLLVEWSLRRRTGEAAAPATAPRERRAA